MSRIAQKTSRRAPALAAMTPDCTAIGRLAMDSFEMWLDASMVIWLRSVRLAKGGRLADHEAGRMVTEKLDANWQLGLDMMFNPARSPDELARRSIEHYAPRVRANRRRLSR